MLAVLWLARKTALRPFFFIWAYFLVALLPVLGLINNAIFRYGLVFDHFQYLASMGPLALVAVGLRLLGKRLASFRPWLPLVMEMGVPLVLAALSWRLTWNYQSERTLWISELRRNPTSPLALANLGAVYITDQEWDKAWLCLENAVKIEPNDINANNDLGIVLGHMGKDDAAVAVYRKVIQLKPDFVHTHANLALLLTKMGRWEESMVEYRKVLELRPEDSQAHEGLGVAYMQMGLLDDSVAELEKAIAIDSHNVLALHNLGVVFIKQGRRDEAAAQFRKALEIDPSFAPARDYLAHPPAF